MHELGCLGWTDEKQPAPPLKQKNVASEGTLGPAGSVVFECSKCSKCSKGSKGSKDPKVLCVLNVF